MFKRIILIFTLLNCLLPAFSQVDSFNYPKTIGEIVITATRSPRSVLNIPVPVQIITKNYIQSTGSQKLIDILQQQTGLVLADNPLGAALQGYPNPFGAGIQMQGLDPAYTLILLDGEPLMGRNAGILNLGRIAVGNIKQIEIVKGPATSLYGSEAMAGVINIITEKPLATHADVAFHYGSHNSAGITANAFYKANRSGYRFFADRHSSIGYDLDKSIYGKTSDPFHTYTLSMIADNTLSDKTELQTSVRYFSEKQLNNYLVYTAGIPEAVHGTTTESDQSVNSKLTHIFSEKVKASGTVYATTYHNHASVFLQKNNNLFETVFLDQALIKPELQAEIGKGDNKFISGAGYNYETINSNRYSSRKEVNRWYVYVQQEIKWKNLNAVAGVRADKNSLFKTQVSPKISLSLKYDKLIVNGSVGRGFKAPDFRQQFLDFTNSLVGYTLLGANEIGAGLTRLQRQGEIDPNIDITPWLSNHSLSPERSVGYNLGLQYTPIKYTKLDVNFFRNDIYDLIERYNLPFTKTNNQAIFSYVNVSKAYTQGFDVTLKQALSRSMILIAGYQFLQAKDKDVIDRIKQGAVYKRDPVTFNTTLTSLKDYGGLFNRAKHSTSVQLLYKSPQKYFDASIRASFRGRVGYSDINGNNILDDSREYTDGYVMLNATVSRDFFPWLKVQAGSENILDHLDRERLPNLSGRTCFINCAINLNKHKINTDK